MLQTLINAYTFKKSHIYDNYTMFDRRNELNPRSQEQASGYSVC